MLLDTPHSRLACSGRVAHLELRGASFEDLDRVMAVLLAHPAIEILMVQGCASSLREPDFADPAEVAIEGRRRLREWEDLPVVTIACLNGLTTGRWLELALACDVRLATATPDSWIGFQDRPRWGSTARVRRLTGRYEFGLLTPREAHGIGLVDAAFCVRRERIEWNSWIDRLEDHPRKRRYGWWATRRAAGADERELADYLLDSRRQRPFEPPGRGLPIDSIELRRCPQAVPTAIEFLLRGGTVVTDDPERIGDQLHEPLIRSRVTPLEWERARDRVLGSGRARLVLESESGDPFAIVRAVFAPHARPIRLGFPVLPDCHVVEMTAGTAQPMIADWLRAVGCEPFAVPDSPRLAIRPALAAYWDEALLLAAEGHAFDRIDDASAAVANHAPFQTLDAIGASAAASLAPRLRPFADAGLREMFYHADRPNEVNALAAAMLGTGPHAMIDEDEMEEIEVQVARDTIVRRLRGCIANLDPGLAAAAGFHNEWEAPRSTSVERRAA